MSAQAMALPELPDPEICNSPPRKVVVKEARRDPDRMAKVARAVVPLLLFSIVLGAAHLAWSAWPVLRLRFAGRQVSGVVTRKSVGVLMARAHDDPSSRPRVQEVAFEFPVDGGRRVSVSARVDEKTFSRVREGGSLILRYDPADAARRVEIEGQTFNPMRESLWRRLFVFGFTVCLTLVFARTTAGRSLPMRRLCSHGTAMVGEVVRVQRGWLFGTTMTVRYRKATGREKTVRFELPTPQADAFSAGTSITLLQHPRMSWIVMPYRLTAYRVV